MGKYTRFDNGYAKDKDRDPSKMDVRKRVIFIQQMFDRYQTYWQPDLERYVVNARALWGLQYGQWPSSVIQKLLDQGRRPPTYNVLLDKAETFIGSIISNAFVPRYSPTQGKMNDLVLKLQDMYYSDRALMEWEMIEIETLLDSSSGVGFEKMVVSNKSHELGNISWARGNPRRTLLNPNWKTSNLDDLRDYIDWTKMSVTEIMEFMPIHKERIMDLRRREETTGINYGENIGITDYKTIDQKYGDLHTVIQLHWVEKKTMDWEYDRKNGCLFPETDEDFHSKEDIAKKQKYIKANELTQGDITFLKKTKVTKYIQCVIPTLDPEVMFIDSEDMIQTGNLNIYPLGMKMEGQYQGMVDREIDVQRAINKSEMNIEDIERRSAHGCFLLDKALTGGDAELEEEIEQAWNDNGGRTWVAEGSTADLGQHGGVIELAPSLITNDLFTNQQRRYALMDKFSKVPAAWESRTDQPREANRLFENKVALGKLGTVFFTKLWEMHQKAKAMAYARQAKITYAGSTREFSSKFGGEPVQINTQTKDEDTGLPKVGYDITLLPEMKITMVPAKDGINIKSQIRDDTGALMQILAQDPNNRLAVLQLTSAVVDTTILPEEEKEGLKKTMQLLMMDAALPIMGRIQQYMQAFGQPPQPQQPGIGPQMVQQAAERGGAVPQAITDQSEAPSSQRRMTDEEMIKGTPQQPLQPQRRVA
jgi:hypothetical protein